MKKKIKNWLIGKLCPEYRNLQDQNKRYRDDILKLISDDYVGGSVVKAKWRHYLEMEALAMSGSPTKHRRCGYNATRGILAAIRDRP